MTKVAVANVGSNPTRTTKIKNMLLQTTFCDPPKATEYDEIIKEYERKLLLTDNWSIVLACKVESKSYPTDKWGILLLRNN